MSGYPTTIKIDEIKNNPAYDAARMTRYGHFYSGAVRENAASYLIMRDIERAQRDIGTEGGKTLWETRMERAWYNNYVGDMVDYLIASMMKKTPRFESDAPYWEGLNDVADLDGNCLSLVLRDLFIAGMVTGRAYIGAAAAENPEDLRLAVLDGLSVQDWASDAEGLLYVRTYRETSEKASAFAASGEVVRRWTYYFRDRDLTYRAGEKDTSATLERENEHSFGRVPIVPIRIPESLWVMRRLDDTMVSLFNHEVSIRCYLESLAYPYKVFNTEGSLERVLNAQLAAIHLRAGETFNYVGAPLGGYDALTKEREHQKKTLLEKLQTLAQNAAAIPQAGRMSGETVKAMRDPLQVLLQFYAQPYLDGLMNWIDMVKDYRRETVEVTVSGLDEFEGSLNEVAERIGVRPVSGAANPPEGSDE